jgi:hypothetical protein
LLICIIGGFSLIYMARDLIKERVMQHQNGVNVSI